MKKPCDRGTKIDQKRYDWWHAQYSGYCYSVTLRTIEMWLDQFNEADKDLAARILDSIQFVTFEQISHGFRDLLSGLDGWNIDDKLRRGRWFFVPFSGAPGESADTMIHRFRQANNMGGRKFNSLFIYRSEIVSKKAGVGDTIVFIDDFSGSGKQAIDGWHELFSELVVGGARVILLLVAATNTAFTRIREETDMQPYSLLILHDSDNVFNEECKHFNELERERLLVYCKKADPAKPQGYGKSGLLLVFAHGCPNNTLPILHANNSRWRGLFPRYI